MRKTTRALIALGTLWLCRANTAEADTVCGYNQPFVDAPNGYLITSRSHDTVAKSVIVSLGEYYTHTMLSHGFGWFTHSTMRVPSTFADNAPHLDPAKLRAADPGVSQITADATYTSLYGADNGGVDDIAKRSGGVEGETVANYFWNSVPYRWDNGGFWRLMQHMSYPYHYDGYWEYHWDDPYACPDGCPTWVPGSDGIASYNVDIPYSLVQYANIDSNEIGKVCSTLMAWGTKEALGRNVPPRTYSHTQTVTALNALYSKVFNQCKAQGMIQGVPILVVVGLLSGFDVVIGYLAGETIEDKVNHICGELANQVTNCFIDPNQCGNSTSTPWNTARNNTAVAARTISPDRIATYASYTSTTTCWCAYGDPYDPYCTDYTCSYPTTLNTSVSSPWATHSTSPITFSGPGNTYSCWAAQ